MTLCLLSIFVFVYILLGRGVNQNAYWESLLEVNLVGSVTDPGVVVLVPHFSVVVNLDKLLLMAFVFFMVRNVGLIVSVTVSGFSAVPARFKWEKIVKKVTSSHYSVFFSFLSFFFFFFLNFKQKKQKR